MGRTPEIFTKLVLAGGVAAICATIIPTIRGMQQYPEDACTPGQKIFQLEVDQL